MSVADWIALAGAVLSFAVASYKIGKEAQRLDRVQRDLEMYAQDCDRHFESCDKRLDEQALAIVRANQTILFLQERILSPDTIARLNATDKD